MLLSAIALAAGFVIARSRFDLKNESPSFARVTFRGRVRSAAFTPDGASVLYTAEFNGGKQQLFLVRLGTAEPQLLGEAQGSIIGISKLGEVGLLKGRVLARMPMGGGAPRGVAEGVGSASWSPDGTNFTIVRETAAGRQIEYPIGTPLVRGVILGAPRVSPDEKHLAYFEFDSGRFWLSLVDLKTKKSRRVAGTWEGTSNLVWHPGSNRIFVSVNSGTHHSLFAVTLDGNIVPVAPIGRGMNVIDIAADGRLLVVQRSQSIRMFRRALQSGTEDELSWLDATIAEDVSDDGETILFSEVGDGGGDRAATYLYRGGTAAPVRLVRGTPRTSRRTGSGRCRRP